MENWRGWSTEQKEIMLRNDREKPETKERTVSWLDERGLTGPWKIWD